MSNVIQFKKEMIEALKFFQRDVEEGRVNFNHPARLDFDGQKTTISYTANTKVESINLEIK